jgi:hypothetical protein
MRQFSHRKGTKVLISAATELRRIQAWGLHFAQQILCDKMLWLSKQDTRLARANTSPEWAIDY